MNTAQNTVPVAYPPAYPSIPAFYPPVPQQADVKKDAKKSSESGPFGSDYRLESQGCGTGLAVFFGIMCILSLIGYIGAFKQSKNATETGIIYCNVTGAVLYLIFFILIVKEPEFLAGKPGISKFYLPIANYTLNLLKEIFIFVKIIRSVEIFLNVIVAETIIFGLCLFMYWHSDDSKSAMLYAKPWIYRKIEPFFYPFPYPNQHLNSYPHPQPHPYPYPHPHLQPNLQQPQMLEKLPMQP